MSVKQLNTYALVPIDFIGPGTINLRIEFPSEWWHQLDNRTNLDLDIKNNCSSTAANLNGLALDVKRLAGLVATRYFQVKLDRYSWTSRPLRGSSRSSPVFLVHQNHRLF